VKGVVMPADELPYRSLVLLPSRSEARCSGTVDPVPPARAELGIG